MDRACIGIHLLHVLLSLCILGECAQNNLRGRIVSRIRSDQFVIPKHHQKNALDIRTGQPYTAQGPVCSDMCRPRWMKVINNLAGLNPNVSEPVCEFAHVFTPCTEANHACESTPVPFTCCPSYCMPAVSNCFTPRPPDHLCIPRSIQPWIRTLYNLNVW